MIRCQDLNQFLNCIGGLTLRGLVFEADAETLTIKLTGDY